MEPATNAATIVETTFAGFGTQLTGVAPELLSVGLIVFAVPMIFSWGKRLVS